MENAAGMNEARLHPLIAFYRDGARDDRGRTLAEIAAWDDDRLEAVHDFIQWLFPLPERSGANPGAPVLNAEAIAEFRGSAEMRARLRTSFDRMLQFYGLAWSGDAAAIVRAGNFAARADNWLWPMNHNHLRMTRILRSAQLLGLEMESAALFRALDDLYRDFPGRITARTFVFWSETQE
jgi:hypothetical protein